MKVKRLFAFTLIILLLLSSLSFNVSASAANIYTVQYLDKATNQAIVPPIIGAFDTSAPLTVNGQVNYNGYQLESVQVNGQLAVHTNGSLTIPNATADSYSIIYFYTDKEGPKASIKPYAYFDQNGDNNIPDILSNLYDNSGVSNISMRYVGTPINTADAGIQSVEIELSDRSENKTVLKGEVAVVGKSRYTATFIDGSSDKQIREKVVAPLSVGENKSLQFSFPAGYELKSVSVDGNEQKSGTVQITNAEERNYNIVFNLKDTQLPVIKKIGPSSFQKGDDIQLEQLFMVTDNSGEPITLIGNIVTNKVGTFSVPVTARDATGNYTTINFNYTVYGKNTYTIQYLQNNQHLMPQGEPVQFSTNDSVVITLPVTYSGFTLSAVDLGINQNKGTIDLKSGKVTLANLTDASFVCKAIYVDTEKPLGTARTDIKLKTNAKPDPMQCLASVYDNGGIEGLTASFSGATPDTSVPGIKNAIVLLKDSAGNISNPISVTLTVEGEDTSVRRAFSIKYIDRDTGSTVGNATTLTANIGRTIDATDILIPTGYRIAENNWSKQLTLDDADNGVKIMVRAEQFSVRIRYTDNNSYRVIKTETLVKGRNATITRGDLSIPSGYKLVSGNFTHTVTEDDTLDIDVERRDGEEPDEYTITIKYVNAANINTVIDTQKIRTDYGRYIESADLNLPTGYDLFASFSRHRVTDDNTLTVRVRKISASDIVINYMNGTKNVGVQTLNNYTDSTVPVSVMLIPSGYTLADPTKTSYPKAEKIDVAVKQGEVSVYIVRQVNPNEHADITVPGKSNNFKVLQTYKNSDGANTSQYPSVLERIDDTKNNTVYYIVDESSVSADVQEQNPLGSSIKVEITDGVIYLATNETGTHRSYITGYDIDGRREFRPDRALTRAEFSMLLYTNFISPFKGGTYSTSSFEDVKTDAWYFQAVESMRQLHIISGYEEKANGQTIHIFKPDQAITRAEAATLLSRIRNVKPQYVQAKYNDISDDAWFSRHVADSARMGYFRYTEGEFKPNAPMTRGETIFALNVAMDKKPFQAADYRNPFEDLSPTHPYYADIMEAVITHDFVMNGDTERRPGNE